MTAAANSKLHLNIRIKLICNESAGLRSD
jgi:hypothetical protein